MSWPAGSIDTTHVDADTDSPLLARSYIKTAIDKINQIVSNGEPVKLAGNQTVGGTKTFSSPIVGKLASGEMFSGYVSASATTTILPLGWSASKLSTGRYQITHGLNLADANNLARIAMPTATGADLSIMSTNQTVDYFVIETRVAGTLADCGFHFICKVSV